MTKRKKPTIITPAQIPGKINFFAEAYSGEGEEGAGLMLIQIQIHPLRDDSDLFNKVVDAVNKAASDVLKDEGIVELTEPVTVFESGQGDMQMPEDCTKVH